MKSWQANQGCDTDTLSVLAFTSERQLFDKYTTKREQFCSKTLSSTPYQSRMNCMLVTAVITQLFIYAML